SNFVANGWSGQNDFSMAAVPGIVAAIPFAIWFFLAIEGVAMAAEEAKDPKRTIPRAYIGGILTLVFLAMGVMVFAGGAGDWKALSNINDPLPQAMKMIVGENSGWLHMLVWIGLFGLVASFHGIIIGYSRQIFALSRAGYMPKFFGVINDRFQTPHRAIIAGAVVGMVAILGDNFEFAGQTLTANLITMAVFGAIVMYIVSMMSLFALRKKEPDLERPFAAVAYPLFPTIALVMALICLVTMIYFNQQITLVFFGLMALGYVYFSLTQHHRDASADNKVVA
ncbi:MAG: amino acid permease, partial [Methylotenera sp.]|nr:amino acid permease [Methylotenera sp.]